MNGEHLRRFQIFSISGFHNNNNNNSNNNNNNHDDDEEEEDNDNDNNYVKLKRHLFTKVDL